MFHRFSAAPAKARGGQAKGAAAAGSALASSNANTNANTNANNNTDNSDPDCHEPTVLPLAKRQKTARACDRCRLHRIKCDEQKPCAQCVGIKAKCIVSYAPPRPSQQNNSNNDTACKSSSSSTHPRSDNGSRGCHSARASISTGTSDSNSTGTGTGHSTASSSPNISPSYPPSRMSMSQDGAWPTRTPPDNMPKECFDLPTPTQGFFANGQLAFSHASALGGSLFPQLPHPAVPLGERPLATTSLLKNQRSYYLRLFWDVCHPLVQIMSETEFAELEALPPPNLFDEYSVRASLVDSMIALGIQHSHATGLTGRILGLQQPPSRQYYHATASSEATWSGFEYFNRCRECMRTSTEVTMEGLRCHILMALYLMKGNAFCDAYNMIGITVRKAYIAKLHRLPPSHMPEAVRTARMQLWSTLFSLDVQCSLQLDMPTASQKSLVKCPFPTEDALARYISSTSRRVEGMSPFAYSIRLANLAVIVTDTSACVSTADLDDDSDDDSNSPAALENHALKLSSCLENLEVWRDRLPSELRLSRCGTGSGTTEVLDFDRDLSLPPWLQRQAVLIELHYHNAYTLIQRPFIRLRYAHSSGVASGKVTPTDSQQPHVDLHITSAFHHAAIIVDTVFTVCSTSDVLYGWAEVLQPLWNATLTIVAYAYANSLSPVVPRVLDLLTRAQAVFESFSSSSPTAHSAKDIVQSLASSLQNTVAHGSCTLAPNDPMSWDLFASLLEEPQATSAGLEDVSAPTDLTSGVLFPPFTPSAPHINASDFSTVPMQFGET